MRIWRFLLEPCSQVAVQRVPGGRVQRDHPRLAELRVSDDEAVSGDVIHRQCERFADAQAGRGDEPEQVMPGQRGDGAGRSHGQCRRQEFPDIRDRHQAGSRPPLVQTAQRIARRHFVTRILGVQPSSKVMYRAQPSDSFGLRFRPRRRCPVDGGRGANERFITVLGEPGEAVQHPFAPPEPVAELLFHRDEARDLFADCHRHRSIPPIQGWATSCNMTASVFA